MILEVEKININTKKRKEKNPGSQNLLRVYDEPLLSADAGDCPLLILLDLGATFDTLDHQILTERLQKVVGVEGRARDWIPFFLCERKRRAAERDRTGPDRTGPG
ncbi:hypothetical protein F2P81_005114 [Scophthalmus maximus]|uniref:Reverse transcriptase domain-containing protein n=1 Tax=Scophthalmus maximus TaxID=52904 RepID=A0A6A4THL7_SCOMX|nr:hypothetical protein F2P81_005114 [Scophthalmus maximus]